MSYDLTYSKVFLVRALDDITHTHRVMIESKFKRGLFEDGFDIFQNVFGLRSVEPTDHTSSGIWTSWCGPTVNIKHPVGVRPR